MDEASLCDRVALMQSGKILAIDPPAKINAGFGKKLWAVRAANMFGLLKTLQAWEQVYSCYSFGEHFHVVMNDENANAPFIQNYLLQQHFSEIEVNETAPNIEDSFMKLMKAEN
jgi:ABC-type multidrug transport system, ATPase component